MTKREKVGIICKLIREYAGYSATEFAKFSNIARSSAYCIESGKTNISCEVYEKYYNIAKDIYTTAYIKKRDVPEVRIDLSNMDNIIREMYAEDTHKDYKNFRR